MPNVSVRPCPTIKSATTSPNDIRIVCDKILSTKAYNDLLLPHDERGRTISSQFARQILVSALRSIRNDSTWSATSTCRYGGFQASIVAKQPLQPETVVGGLDGFFVAMPLDDIHTRDLGFIYMKRNRCSNPHGVLLGPVRLVNSACEAFNAEYIQLPNNHVGIRTLKYIEQGREILCQYWHQACPSHCLCVTCTNAVRQDEGNHPNDSSDRAQAIAPSSNGSDKPYAKAPTAPVTAQPLSRSEEESSSTWSCHHQSTPSHVNHSETEQLCYVPSTTSAPNSSACSPVGLGVSTNWKRCSDTAYNNGRQKRAASGRKRSQTSRPQSNAPKSSRAEVRTPPTGTNTAAEHAAPPVVHHLPEPTFDMTTCRREAAAYNSTALPTPPRATGLRGSSPRRGSRRRQPPRHVEPGKRDASTPVLNPDSTVKAQQAQQQAQEEAQQQARQQAQQQAQHQAQRIPSMKLPGAAITTSHESSGTSAILKANEAATTRMHDDASQCSICLEQFDSAKRRDTHHQQMHTPLLCPRYDWRNGFGDAFALVSHLINVHCNHLMCSNGTSSWRQVWICPAGKCHDRCSGPEVLFDAAEHINMWHATSPILYSCPLCN